MYNVKFKPNSLHAFISQTHTQAILGGCVDNSIVLVIKKYLGLSPSEATSCASAVSGQISTWRLQQVMTDRRARRNASENTKKEPQLHISFAGHISCNMLRGTSYEQSPISSTA